MNSIKKQNSFPIDLVYLWVDDNDPIWKKKKESFLKINKNNSKETTGDARWRNNDELKYSLRSVEKYAPWINHIYIITDQQTPSWLKENHPKVTIVDHTDILSEEALPVFNSQAIESRLHKIPNLSEHFIFGNDDFLFVKPISPEIFFSPNGKVIVRMKKFSRRKANKANYNRTIKRMQDLIFEKFGEMIPLAPHHSFDAYLKSDYEFCVTNYYKEKWEETAFQRFRSEDDMQRCFVSYYMIIIGHAVLRKVGRYNRIDGLWNKIKAFLTHRYANDSRCIDLNISDYNAALKKYNPMMICVNDNQNTTENQRRRLVPFLEYLFPEHSSFEKITS